MVVLEKKIDRKSNNSSYHYSQIIIHWLVALLVIYQFTFGGNIEFLELESCIHSKTNSLGLIPDSFLFSPSNTYGTLST